LIENLGQTDRVTALPRSYTLDIDLWPLPMVLSFNPRQAMVMTHRHKHKFKGQSVQKIDGVETHGRTEVGRTDGPTDWRTDERYWLHYLSD